MHVETVRQCSLGTQQVVACLSFIVFSSLNIEEHVQKHKTKSFCKSCFSI